MAGRYTRGLQEITLGDVAEVGGKGANLGELTRARFPVPPGFVVIATAFDEFLSVHGLDAQIRSAVARLDFADHAEVERTTAEIRHWIGEAEIPRATGAEIGEAYGSLGGGKVAVRSSSAVPGLGVSSFPGQMDTFYNVEGTIELLHKVRQCWASLWTARAAANRWNQGIDHFAVRVGVVVQQMVTAEYSGVAFTVNPVDGADEFVVEAVPGLGDALVGGRVTPECFVVGKPIARIEHRPPEATVPESLILRVAEVSKKVEAHYGRPQDIEWAFAGGQIHILQSRNVKSREIRVDYAGLERWNKKPAPGDEAVIWTRAWSDEVLTRAITPMFYSVQADLITTTYDFIYRCYGLTELLPMRLMRFHKNRGYFSTHYLKACLRYAPKFALTDDALKFFTPEQKEEVQRAPFLAWRKLKSELRLSVRYRKFTLTRCYGFYYQRWLPELRRRLEELERIDLERGSNEDLKAYFKGMEALIKKHCEPIGFGVMVHTFAMVSLLEKALHAWLGDASPAAVLLSGLPGNSTCESNQQTWALAQKIRSVPELAEAFADRAADVIPKLRQSSAGTAFLAEFEAFRRRYLFRGAEDREISFPRWGDDPTLLIRVLQMFLAAPGDAEPQARENEIRSRRQKLTAEIRSRLRAQPYGLVKRTVFDFLLKYAQIYSLFRENQRYEVDRVFYGQRKAALAIGKRLSPLLASGEDIWFLSKEEAFDALNGQLSREQISCLVGPRKAEYRRYLHTPPPMFLKGAQEIAAREDAAPVVGRELRGVAASAGSAAGTARVVRELRELGRVRPGDILVTNSTDPGWTPVFLLIRGLVLETGGILAHGTVLSREYGIPAVTSVKNATEVIRDGETITIDGSLGVVVLPETAQSASAAVVSPV